MTFKRMVDIIKKKSNNYKILVVGLDNAGKTSLLNAIFNKKETIPPTFGYSIYNLEMQEIKSAFIDENKDNKVTTDYNDKNNTYKSDNKVDNISEDLNLLDNNIRNFIKLQMNNKDISYINNKIENIKMLTILDIGGQTLFKKYWSNYFENVDGAFFIFDCTDSRDFSDYLNTIMDLNIPICIIANKCDLNPNYSYNIDGENYKVFKTSIFDIKSIKNAFYWLFDKIVKS